MVENKKGVSTNTGCMFQCGVPYIARRVKRGCLVYLNHAVEIMTCVHIQEHPRASYIYE